MSSSEATVTRRRWFQWPTFFPVLHRELREGSHRAPTYYVRVMAAGCAVGVLWLLVHKLESQINASSVGQILFSSLHTFLLVMIVAAVPLMTADCIASEKRSGTLGLLFLTPLTARGIMIGKSCAHAFRAFTLWLSVFPILVIPFLMGGVAWFDVGTAFTIQFCAIILSIASGLLASALFRKRNSAFAAAFVMGTGFSLLLAASISLCLAWRAFPPTRGYTFAAMLRSQFSSLMLFLTTGYGSTSYNRVGRGGWSAMMARPGYAQVWIILLGIAMFVAFAFLTLALIIGAWQIRRSWRDKISNGQTRWQVRFCTPIFLKRFKGQMQHLMDRNPVAWLQQYSWRARTTKWGLCFAFLVVETFAVSVLQNGYDIWQSMTNVQALLLTVMAVMFVFVGVSSFQTEKQTGALELMLITPLRVNQIIVGRVYGLWKQFLPAFLVIAGSHIATITMFDRPWHYYGGSRVVSFEPALMLTYFTVALGFLNLPVFATYFALRVRNLIAAGIMTGVCVFLAPIFGLLVFINGFELVTSMNVHGSLLPVAIGFLLGNASFAAITVFLLHHSLQRRIYSF
jgi:ABC-type transport system involved in cytochrome c biogenesis permease component